MAEVVVGAFLSSSFQVTFQKLASVDVKDYFSRNKLDGVVEKLDITLNSINQVLDEAENKQYESPPIKEWLDHLKHAVYEADQILDEIATDAQLDKLKAESEPITSMVLGFFSIFTNPFESRINELLEELEFLAEQKDVLELKGGKGGVSWKSSKILPTTSLVDESIIYGRDGEKEKLIKFLLSDNHSGNQVPIISIVGLGGMGKTTLAQLVYNNRRMKEHFVPKAWVYVSESFDVVGLTKAILRSFKISPDGEELDPLQRQLQQELTGKKYLLVLDDVNCSSNQNRDFWERLLLPFNHGSSGSKIIVTTRNTEVASVMKSTQLLHLQRLEKSNCWSSFVRHAFHGRNVSEYPNLESIGKKIVDKCDGLPLAVKTLGNLLGRKFSQTEWVNILETAFWRLSDRDSTIDPVLRLSYHNLPSNLKRCFAFCSIFPKGYEFDKDRLINCWMAEGLLKCHRTYKSEQALGNEFFDGLESISFFQQATSSWNDDQVVFVMHDLVNDLANSVSGEFCYRIEDDRVHDIPERTRHIWCSLDLKDGDRKLEQIYKIKGLRSLIIETAEVSNNVQHDMFRRLKYLRMLSFSNCNISELADEISNLKLLRYLDLSRTQITSLPDSICMLYNLQTLLLRSCFKLTELPSDFCKLVNLRHLDMSGTGINKMPKHIGRLNHLQTLTPNFVVGEHNGSDIKELAELNHLQGKLGIEGLENVIDPADAAAANLKDKKHLEKLGMIYSATREMDDSIMERDVSVLEALQPNSNLSGLEIKHYCGSSFPNWLGVCHLPNLVSLELDGCKFCSMLPPLGNLPFLKELSISGCFEIEIIGEEFYGNNSSNVPFRSLEILQFKFMSSWKEWLCLEGFPLLKELYIFRCPKLKSSLPQNLPSLQKLVIIGCQELEASIPKAANISELQLEGCEKILVNESPSSIKIAVIDGITESSLEKILFNNTFLEELYVNNIRGANLECSSLDLRCYNTLRILSIRGWCYSFLPFALHLFTNLHSLTLCNCPELESFPGEGFPSSLSCLGIHKCPKLVAWAFLSSVFQVTFERLASRDFRDSFRKGLVKKLEITLNSINQVLDEAEEKQYQSLYVKKWLDDLKHEMYEVDQLLDEIATSAQRKRKGKVRRFESRIKQLLEKLEFLAKQKEMLGLKGGNCASNEGGVSWKSSKRLPTSSLVDESKIYGRDADKEEIINCLLSDNDSGNQVPIISIVGLGGMGKTTLAQLVYNDQRIQEPFELKAWVYVSESFDVVGLTKAILRSFEFSADGEELHPLQRQLQQRLSGKKYLLVLDDVWNQNEECWERLLLPFNRGSSGSKIIVTTRSKEVASVMKYTQLLPLQQLEDRNCWNLFVRHAFDGRNVNEYPNLESIGKKIVDKCGGLPLAVKTLGNLLRRKFSQLEWLRILETDLLCLMDGDSNINPVLRLSYHNLPSNLKRCFAFCSIFPKGYEFLKGELIKLWMAEGLLKCHRTDKSEEELGNEFFDDLESISFFQQDTPWHDDERDFFVMHDLVNDLAKSVSGEFCYRIEGDRVHDIPERTRHIWCSLDLNDGDRILEHIYKIKGLHNLMVQPRGSFGAQSFKISNNVQHDMFSRLKYLRTLSFCGCNLTELADEISNLKLLRYLDLSRTQITSLPDSICMLYNLQTLLLRSCFKLTELPSDFCKLVNLRHLDMSGTGINKMPKHIGRLNHLQTLTPNFVVGEHNGSDIKELAELNHLQGKLGIEGLENVIDPADAAAANLKDKKHLEELCMVYSATREMDGSIIERDVFVLEALQPNSNLSGLEIDSYCGSSFPNWLRVRHLPNLVSLKLDGCKFCSRLPPLGQFPSLKELSISGCFEIEIIGEEFYGNSSSNIPFRSLEILRFEFMSGWKEWVCLEGCFPSLKELSISCCPKLKSSLPQNLPSLQMLEIYDCQELEASIPKAANMSELELHRCENLECSSLDLRCCNTLRTLSIGGWHSSSFPLALHLFANLHSLKLDNCPELESLPGGGFPSSLSSLEIDKCPKLIASREKWRLFELNSLKAFIVGDEFENVECFPEEGLLPPSLNSLKLVRCSKLRILNYKGLLHLESLESLCTQDCPCLERLPEEVLPNSLSTLKIIRCSLLKQQYEKEEGERWNKIQHIPSVWIDFTKQK